MTSDEEFAHKRLEAEQFIRQQAPAYLQEQLIALLRPIVALTAAPTEDPNIPIGASKFGGSPDVPLDFQWPTWKGQSLGFLAQINLEEVAPFDVDSLLPKNGMLWFFLALNQDTPLYGYPEEFGGWQIIFERKPLALQRVTPPENSHWTISFIEEPDETFPILSQRVTFGAGWAFPRNSFESLYRHSRIEEDWDEFERELRERSPHRMLTCPYAPQLSPFIIAANAWQEKSGDDIYSEETATNEWDLLLQLDTGTEGFFADIYDLQWLYFLIRRDDLKNADFSRVWFNN